MTNATPVIPVRDFLTDNDPNPIEIVNAESGHPVVFVCEHAGKAIPERLGNLGIQQEELNTHIGWDIGAEAVTRKMATAMGAPAIFQRYSRLVIDCNRPPNAADSIPAISDKTVIPVNANLTAPDRAARTQAIFDPYQSKVSDYLSSNQRCLALSIHSFNHTLGGVERPWDIGFLYRKDTTTSKKLAVIIQDIWPDLLIGMNQPYQIDDAADWFVPMQGEAHGIAHSLIEIRNDHIATPDGQARWAKILTTAISHLLEDL